MPHGKHAGLIETIQFTLVYMIGYIHKPHALPSYMLEFACVYFTLLMALKSATLCASIYVWVALRLLLSLWTLNRAISCANFHG